jgi:hypothetical protein
MAVVALSPKFVLNKKEKKNMIPVFPFASEKYQNQNPWLLSVC